MKLLLISLLKRNAIVFLAFTAVLVGCRMSIYAPPPWVVTVLAIVGLLCALLWANAVLIERGCPVIHVLLSLLLVPALGFPMAIVSPAVARPLVEWKYRCEGFQMVGGCNGGEANKASFQVYSIEQLLAWYPDADSNIVAQMRSTLAMARAKAQVLRHDCRSRGHCGTLPWKADWDKIDPGLKASEDALNKWLQESSQPSSAGDALKAERSNAGAAK